MLFFIPPEGKRVAKKHRQSRMKDTGELSKLHSRHGSNSSPNPKEAALRQFIAIEYHRANLSGIDDMYRKALKWVYFQEVLCALSTTTGFETHYVRLLELVNWIGVAETQTFALERFVRHYRTLTNTPLVNCHVNALDMLGLRMCNLLSDHIITAALETVCA